MRLSGQPSKRRPFPDRSRPLEQGHATSIDVTEQPAAARLETKWPRLPRSTLLVPSSGTPIRLADTRRSPLAQKLTTLAPNHPPAMTQGSLPLRILRAFLASTSPSTTISTLLPFITLQHAEISFSSNNAMTSSPSRSVPEKTTTDGRCIL